jgi:two-component system, NtrC family, sensor kinase
VWSRNSNAAASLEEHQNHFDEKLHEAKLSSLAEFAAGASHEINNPLAVITTNVQLLLSHEDDEERVDRFEAVLRQTKRIHDLLNGTRQFARPPQAIPALLSVSSWVNAVAKDCEPEATARNVSLDLPRTAQAGRLWADAGQVRAIVNHLVKNAINAAGDEGWVRVSIETLGTVSRIIVSDSGEAPSHRTTQHLFDPFFSGREAGRGRGLGLPIAWQLARQNGGTLVYDRVTEGPTRFVLTLPAVPGEVALRASA